MPTALHWVEGSWPGRLSLAARPRGGDWLEDEVAGWRSAGLNTVLSLLTPEEELDLGLENEAQAVKGQNMKYVSLPIEDLQVPRSETTLAKTLDEIDVDLSAGKNVVIHCRQGNGRTGLVAACLLVT